MIKKVVIAVGLGLMLCCNAMAGGTSDVTVAVLAKSGSSWDGASLPGYPDGDPEITLLRIEIPPGVVLDTHMHPVINAGVLISGELTVVTEEEKTLHLKAGDAIVEVVGTWHYGKNEGAEPAEIIVFYAGVADEPITVKPGFD
jgi:quercetin dioxygenase-like cupin family protein